MIFLGLPTQLVALPAGFVYLNDLDPTILQDLKYASDDNFVGRHIQGYEAPRCILTRTAALKLMALQQELQRRNLGLKVFDCYRPMRAVDDFVHWSTHPLDQKRKSTYYPNVDKKDFFKLGFVAKKSAHARGSTVDVTLVRYDHHQPIELKMGAIFDFMDDASHPLNQKMDRAVIQNRILLRRMMEKAGFKPIETEWWHFTLKEEPFIHQSFNFVVK